jgi:FKBP-type peptidyl-prolyl cis-trans isomerase
MIGKGNVIRACDEGVTEMMIGGIRMLSITPLLAYGVIVEDGVISSNASLGFEV